MLYRGSEFNNLVQKVVLRSFVSDLRYWEIQRECDLVNY